MYKHKALFFMLSGCAVWRALTVLAVLSFLPACSPTTSETAAAIDNDAANFLQIYDKLRSSPSFQTSVETVRAQSLVDIKVTIPNSLQIGGRTFNGVRTIISKSRTLQVNSDARASGSIRDLLVQGNLLSDRLLEADARDMLAIVVAFLKAGGNERNISEDLSKYSADQLLKAVNTAVIYDALQQARSKALKLVDAPDVDVSTGTVKIGGSCMSVSNVGAASCIVQNLTGVASDIWGTTTQLSANKASRANVVARQVSVQVWNNAAAKEQACKFATPPAGQCTYHTDSMPPGPSPAQNGPSQFKDASNHTIDCGYKVWTCACAGDAAQKTCNWQSGSGSTSATDGMINPILP